MTLLEKLRTKLGPELFDQVETAVGDDFDWDVVPRARLNKVIGQRNALSEQLQEALETAEQPKETSSSDDALEELRTQHAKELSEVTKRYAILDHLRDAGARDPKVLLPLLKLDDVSLQEDGTLQGLDEQLAPIKESHPYLYVSEEPPVASVSGGTGRASTGAEEEDEGPDPFEAVIASYSSAKNS